MNCDRCKEIMDGSMVCTSYKKENDTFVPDEHYCEDCRIEEDYKSYVENHYITNKILMDVTAGVYDSPGKKALEGKRSVRLKADRKVRNEILWFVDKLYLKTKEFEGGVWFDAGLQKFIKSQTKSGLSGHFRNWHGTEANPTYDGFEMDVRCMSSAARFMITFEATHNDSQENKFSEQPDFSTDVTFITEEDSPYHRMSCQSCHGTPEDILRLCEITIYNWGQRELVLLNRETRIQFGLVPDEKVTIA